MKQWPSKVFQLNTGWDESDASNTPKAVITHATNVDFARRGAVNPRPSAHRATGCVFKTVDTAGTAVTIVTATPANVATVSSTWSKVAMTTIRDLNNELPAMLLRGRVLAYDGTNWIDRLGAASTRVTRGPAFRTNLDSGNASAGAATGSGEEAITAMATDYAYDSAPGAKTVVLKDAMSNVGLRIGTTYASGVGTTARLGTTTATVHTPYATSDLVFLSRTAGANALVEVRLATNAHLQSGRGRAPVICCDQDATSFFVAYVTTTNSIVGMRVNAAGTITAAATLIGATGTTPSGFWITNSLVSENTLTLAYTSALFQGCYTDIYNATTLASNSLVVTLNSGSYTGSGPTTCGACSGGNVWVSYVEATSGNLCISRRATAAATSIIVSVYTGVPIGTTGGRNIPSWGIQHQPILWDNRVLLGVNHEPANGVTNYNQNGCTWFVIDITDTWDSSSTSLNGKRLLPSIIARGPTESSCEAWQPFAAVISSDATYYEFGSLDWSQFSQGRVVTGGSGYSQFVTADTPSKGSLAMNRVYWLAPQTAWFGNTTVIAGSVPHGIARGNVHELGWIETRPTIKSSGMAGSGAGLDAGSYTARAVWRYTDESGQVHRSEPSLPVTLTAAANEIWTLLVSAPRFTEKTKEHIYIEYYITDKNPTADSALYLQTSIQCALATSSVSYAAALISTTSEALYTDGDVLENQFVGADGGAVTVGNRCWVSDGTVVFASKLRVADSPEPPQWHADDTLRLEVPQGAGRVVGLSRIEDKLVIFCERSILISTGDGPDNAAAGQDFLVPQLVADVGLTSQRAMAATPAGIFFNAPLSTNLSGSSAMPQNAGGLFLLNPSLAVSFAGQRIQEGGTGALASTTGFVDMVFLPTRDLLVLQAPAVSSVSTTWTLDLRANQFSQWTYGLTDLLSETRLWWTTSSNDLWCFGLEPFYFSAGNSGFDVGSATTAFTLAMTVEDMTPADDPAGWGRVRSIRILGNPPASGTHTVTPSINQDQRASFTALTAVVLPDANTTTWPTGKYDPEWRLPNQKCSTIDVILSAVAVTAGTLPEWTGLEIQYQPHGRAPSRTRN